MQEADRKLIKKFIDGNCSAEEKLHVQQLLLLPDAQIVMEELTWDEWNSEVENDPKLKFILPRWKSKLYNLIGSAEDLNTKKIRGNNKKALLYKYAAIWTGVLLAGGLVFLGLKNIRNKTQVVAIELINKKSFPVKYILPDSSVVYLGTDAKLNYPKKFDSNKREVRLSGEAFFEVKHKAKQSFIVQTGSIQTQVLGTSFKVNAVKNQAVIVAVATGKVGIIETYYATRKTLALLTPGLQVSWNASTDAVIQSFADVNALQKWKTPDIVFNSLPMAEVALQLQERYNIHISFKDKQVSTYRVSGTFAANEQVGKILDMLSYVGNFGLKHTSPNTFNIYKK